ncbi:3-oxoacyl-[acyl-carrier-protein] reductase OS=Ureibacillus acetophenoni OX=614649 GN=SAMN05877842_101438 PE=3 SV=1 [Ureibacillus acetophenoni]
MFDGKVIVITGAAGGLGNALAEHFSKYQCELVLVDINPFMNDGIHKNQANIHLYEVNLKLENQIKEFAEDVKRKLGWVDILINNAAYLYYDPIYELESEQWDNVINVNLRGTFLVTKYISQLMIPQSKGKIVNVSSIAAISGMIGGSAYSASKAGILGFTRIIAKELSKYHINVNAVSPGPLEGDFLNKNSSDEGKQQRIERSLFKRMGKYTDVVEPICFLVSDGADWITGQNIYVDGGFTIN